MRSTRRAARALLAGVALLALLAGCAVAAPGRTAGATSSAATLAREQLEERSQLSDAAVASLVPSTQPGCSAAVAVEGEVLWAGAGGLADLAAGTPVTTKTRFDIASVSKQFTATAILMLQREGKLALSDPIGAYVDGLPAWGATTMSSPRGVKIRSARKSGRVCPLTRATTSASST